MPEENEREPRARYEYNIPGTDKWFIPDPEEEDLALQSVSARRPVDPLKLSDKIGHINCDPAALKDPGFVAAINQMAELAYVKGRKNNKPLTPKK